MNCMEMFEQLEAYHAGTLARAQAEAVEQHLLTCDSCGADFRFQRTLRTELASLPRGISPPGSVWQGIEGRIGSRRNDAAISPGRPAWWQRKGMLAAAALILMTLSSAITAVVLRQDDPVALASLGSDFQVTEATYREAAQELAQALELRRNDLSPTALAVIEQNLRIIDEAIRETQAALANDPRNQGVAGLLWATYEKKIDLLQRAAQHVES